MVRIDWKPYVGRRIWLRERTPASVDELLETRIISRSTVCLAEMTYLFVRLDSAYVGTKDVRRELRKEDARIGSIMSRRPSLS